MELHLITRRWTIRIARTKPAKPSAPSSTNYPMRTSAPAAFTNPRSARPKDVR